jgi:hypothetical protein
MYSSNQISSMLNNQNAGFMNQSAYAANISSVSGMGAPMQTPGFSYGVQDAYGLSGTSKFGVGASSGLIAGAGVGMTGVSMMAGLGFMGHTAGYADPFTGVLRAGAAGFARGGIGGAIGLGAAASLPYMAAMQGMSFAGQQMVRGAQQDYGIHQSLRANATLYNPMSRSGRGFSTTQRDMISDSVRTIAETDPTTDMGELNRIMTKAMRGNMFQGTSSAKEFSRKFKQLTKTLKTMAQVMGSSMEQAMEFFDASKRMGFYNKSDIALNAANAMTMSGGGLSARGIIQAQAQGSAMARSQGYSGAQGAMLARSSVQGARDMFQSGLVSERDLGEMTGGLRGEQAYRSLGRQMQQASYSLARSGIGRPIYAALAEKVDGKFTGRLDKTLLQQFKSGQLTASEVRKLAADKLQNAGRDSKLSFLNMEKDIAGSFASGAGAQGWMGVMNLVKNQRGSLSTEETKLLMKRMTGMGRRQVEYIMRLYEKQDEMNYKNAKRATDLLRKRAEKADMAQNATFSGLMRQVTHSLAKYTSQPLQRAGVRLSRGLRDVAQNIRDNTLGQARTAGTTEYGLNTVQQAMMGDTSAYDRDLSGFNQSVLSQRTDLSGGALRGLIGQGPGRGILQSLGRHTNLVSGGAGSRVSLYRGLLGGETTVNQSRMVAFADIMKKADDDSRIATNKLGEDGRRIRSALSNMHSDKFAQIMEQDGNSNTSVRRARTAKLADLIYSGASDELRKSLDAKTSEQANIIAKRMGLGAGDERVQRAAREAVVTRFRERGTALDRALGSDALANLAGAGGTLDSMKLGAARRKSLSELVAAGSTATTVSSGVRAGAGIGGASGAFVGSLLGPLGTLIGGALGAGAGAGIGAVGSALFPGKGMSQDEMKQITNDPELMQKYQKMLSGDQREINDALSREGSLLSKAAKSIRGMSPNKLAEMRKLIGNDKSLQLASTLQTFALQSQKTGTQALGMQRDSIANIAGDSFATSLLGERGEGGLAGQLAGLTFEQLRTGRGKLLSSLGTKQMDLAEDISKMTQSQRNRLRGTLGKTDLGKRLLFMSSRLGDKFGQKLETSGLMDATSDAKIKGIMQNMGITLGKKDMEQVKRAISSGDRFEVQKALATKASGPQRESPMTILTTMKGGIEKMAAVSEKLLGVMLTVEEKQGNLAKGTTSRVMSDLKKLNKDRKRV